MHIVLVKQTDEQLAGAQADAVRKFLFDFFRGASESDEKGWRRFIRAMNEGAAGEYFQFKVERQRMGWKHRKQMAFEGKVFDAQERLADKDQFRLWLKVGAGFVDWMAGPRGDVFPIPKSISFTQCSEEEFADYCDRIKAFLRTEHAQHYLFPHVSAQVAEQAMEAIIQPFEVNRDDR